MNTNKLENDIVSPVTGLPNTSLVKRLHKSVILDFYKEKLNLDLSDNFKEVDSYVDVFRCDDTGYKFYYPMHLAGDGGFYDSIIDNGNYYSDWKKEYDFARDLIMENHGTERVLDVGCGKGQFLKGIQSHVKESAGLEISNEAIDLGKKDGILIYNELIDEHAAKKNEYYDCVTAFQVLEHVPNVKGFLEACISCLKTGGLLILSVPNCEPYYSENHFYAVKNVPPHHMGLWNRDAFEKLQNHYPLEMLSSGHDLKISWVKTCLLSGQSMAQHVIPGYPKLLQNALALAIAAGRLPQSIFKKYVLKKPTYGRVYVCYRKV